nr:tandem-95 repeat protein [Accumulibacter sp.]
RLLSFTLADSTLDDASARLAAGQPGGPGDAFEVALIDVHSGRSLLGGSGLTRNDAILNRQADGSEYRASGVSVVPNPDGSDRYTIDLTGIPVGSVLNLAFDLIGFGSPAGDGDAASNSRVTVRDLHLGNPAAAAQARDDSAATAEDTPLLIDVLANDLDAHQPGLVPELLEAPAHGQVVATGDGGFTYTPAPDWHGEDRFSYRLSDGLFASAATVRLTVAPVNDAPRLSGLTGELSEDGSLSLDLGALASDVDGDALTVAVAAPRHGTLARNDDGRYTYRPPADYHGEDDFVFSVSDGQADSGFATVRLNVVPEADTPALALGAGAGAAREIFRTGWESVGNPERTATPVRQDELEGWRLVTAADATPGGDDCFQVWSSGDRIADTTGASVRLYAAADNGKNWLELNDATGRAAQTRAIERRIDTVAGATYQISLDLAGWPQVSTDAARLSVSVDGREIAGAASASPAGALAWQSRSFAFVGAGGSQTIRLASGGRGLMIDDIALSETLPANTGAEDTAIRLAPIAATLQDDDGSETLTVTVADLPPGATLSDGDHRFTATDDQRSATVTDWNLGTLSITPPPDATGRFTLRVVATASEQANESQASSDARVEVHVLPVNDAPHARDARYTLSEGERLTIDFAPLIGDVDADRLTVHVASPDHGELIGNADGTWTYVPQPRYHGADRFRYTVSDGPQTATATVELTITPVNHPPQWTSTPPSRWEVPAATVDRVFPVSGTMGFDRTPRNTAFTGEIGF